MAKATMNTPGIRYFCKAIKAIGIERAGQMFKEIGKGMIESYHKGVLRGSKTKFRSIPVGSSLFIPDLGTEFKITEVISDVSIRVQDQSSESYEIGKNFEFKRKPLYDETFRDIWGAFKNKESVYIFPEGTTHEGPKLDPLKPGICGMALGAYQKYGKKVKLMPCTIHYYNQHIFRSKVFVEYGKPYEIPEEFFKQYETDKKAASAALLKIIDQVSC